VKSMLDSGRRAGLRQHQAGGGTSHHFTCTVATDANTAAAAVAVSVAE